MQYSERDLLSPRKMSVSRMHSLPNDSYMFRPVRPASAPYPLEEVDLSPQHQHSGNLSALDLNIRQETSMELLCLFFLATSIIIIILTDMVSNPVQ